MPATKSARTKAAPVEAEVQASPVVPEAVWGAPRGVPLFLQRSALMVSSPNDMYEQEAESVADMMAQDEPAIAASPASYAPSHTLQRCACGGTATSGGTCAACDATRLAVQRQTSTSVAGGTAPASIVPGGGGQPLPAALRTHFEPRFGHDFGRVRLHTDSQAAASARAVQARAFTAGHDIVFGDGQYAPETAAGRRLLAHELMHVVQQHGQTLHLQRQDEETTATSSPDADYPARAALAVSMFGLQFLPDASATFRPGSKAFQGLQIALYRLLGSQYTSGLADEAFARAVSVGWGGMGTLAGDAAGGEPLTEFSMPLRESIALVTWLEQVKQLQAHLGASQRELLAYGMFASSAWAELRAPDVAAEIGTPFPAWYNETLFRQQLASNVALLRQYIEAILAYRADPSPANRDSVRASLVAITDSLGTNSSVLEAIRGDASLLDHEVYQLLWPSPQTTGAAPGAPLTPVMAEENQAPNPQVASSFLSFMYSQDDPQRSSTDSLLMRALMESPARRELMDHFGRFLARGIEAGTAGDQQLTETPGRATAPPLPAQMGVFPALSGPPGGPQLEASAEADYRFTMQILFPTVFEAFGSYYFDWNYIRIPDERIGTAVDVEALEAESPDLGDVAALRFSRAGRYVVEDVETVFRELGPAGVSALTLVAANAILRFVGTGIRLALEILTMPQNEKSIAFPGPGVYMVRCKALPYQSDTAEIVRPPSVAFLPIIVRDPTELVEARTRQEAALNARDFQRMQELRELLAEPVSHMNEDEKRRELDILERSLSSVGGALEVQREQLVRYRDSLPTGSAELRQVEQQLERLDQIIALRAARAEDRSLTGAEPLIASFIGDTGQSIRLTMEALYRGESDGLSTYWVSDLTTPNSSQDTGVGDSRAAAIMNAVESILRGQFGYGRGYVSVSIDEQIYTRRITASLGSLFSEALDNVTLALSIAVVVAAPFTGGASLVLLLPIGAVGAIPSAYRLINRAIDDTLRFDLQTVMDIVNIAGGLAGLGHALTPLRMVTIGRAFMVMGLGADGLGALLIPVGIAAQIAELEGLPAGERAARILEILGQAMLNVGIMAGSSLARRGRQEHLEGPQRLGPAAGDEPLASRPSDTPGAESALDRPRPGEAEVPGTTTPRAGVRPGEPGTRVRYEATTADGEHTLKLTEDGRVWICTWCTLFDDVYARELADNPEFRRLADSLGNLMDRAIAGGDTAMQERIFNAFLYLNGRLRGANVARTRTLGPAIEAFPALATELADIQFALSYTDARTPALARPRAELAEVVNDVAQLQSRDTRVAGFEDWVTGIRGEAAAVVARAPNPAEVAEASAAALGVQRNIAELYEARRLAREYAGQPDVLVRVGQDVRTAGRSFDISIERPRPGGGVDIVRRIEIEFPEGNIDRGRDMITGITHAAEKIPRGVRNGTAPLPHGASEGTLMVRWPPPSVRLGGDAEMVFEPNGNYTRRSVVDPTQMLGRPGNLLDDMVRELNRTTYANPVEYVHFMTVIDQNGTPLFRLTNTTPGIAPARWTWVAL